MLPNQWTGSTVFKLKSPEGANAPDGGSKHGTRTAAPAPPDKAVFQKLGSLLGAFRSTKRPDSGPLA
eukprot:9188654-Alexandrium_andersonii.AAC.1